MKTLHLCLMVAGLISSIQILNFLVMHKMDQKTRTAWTLHFSENLLATLIVIILYTTGCLIYVACILVYLFIPILCVTFVAVLALVIWRCCR